MPYPRAAIDPAVLQRLYECERSLRKVAAALQVECGIAVSAPTVAAHLRALGIETGKGARYAGNTPRNLRHKAQEGSEAASASRLSKSDV
jgi:hypothetical protein